MGVKSFSRSPSPMVPNCDFRISQECLATLQSAVTKRRVNVNKKDAVIIISEENPFTNKLSEEAQSQLAKVEAGSVVFVFAPSEKEPSPACVIPFCGWRGKTSVRCFGSRADRSHILMLFGENLREINERVLAKKMARDPGKKEEEALRRQKTDDDLPPLDSDLVMEDDGDSNNGFKAEEADNNDDEEISVDNGTKPNEPKNEVEDDKVDVKDEM